MFISGLKDLSGCEIVMNPTEQNVSILTLSWSSIDIQIMK